MLIFSLLTIAGLYRETPDLRDPQITFEILNWLAFTPLVPLLIYAENTLDRNARKATKTAILSLFGVLSVQLTLNGGMEDTSLFAFPTILMLATFFSNRSFANLIMMLFGSLVIILTFCEFSGLKPLNPLRKGFFSIDACIYISLILLSTHALVQVITHDLLNIQTQLIDDHQKAEFIANHDMLTRLPNRYFCEREFEDFFAENNPDSTGYVLFVDVDDFKTINTRFGHKGGDRALEVIAKRLQVIATEYHGLACRTGGDEFIILVSCRADKINNISRHLLEIIAEPFNLSEQTLQVTCSIGVSTVKQGAGFKEVYRGADKALHRAKRLGKNVQVHQSLSDINEESSWGNTHNETEYL